ncbi:unnamed protein product [Closterium sp. NIES-53]
MLLDFFQINKAIYAMYVTELSDEGACYSCVPGDAGVDAAALGAIESAAALGASESTVVGASESAASAEALQTFTLDSGASRSFFRDCTTYTPLAAPVPVSLADPTGGPVVARASTILPCPAVPSGSLSGLHLPTFSTNLVSNAALQDVWVDTFTPGGQRVAIGKAPGLAVTLLLRCLRPVSLHRLARVGYPPTRLSSGTTASVTPHCRVSAACTPVSLSLGFPGPCPPSRARLHYPAFPASRGGSAPLLTPPSFLRPLLLCRLSTWTYVSGVLIPWIRATRRQLRERFWQDLPVPRLHSDRGGEFFSDLLAELCRVEGISQPFTLPASPQQNGIAEHRIGLIMEVVSVDLHCGCTIDPRGVTGAFAWGVMGAQTRYTNKPFYPNGLVVWILTWYHSGLGFESQCVHFGHPSAGGCQRSTGDPRLILGKGYRLVVLGGYGRTLTRYLTSPLSQWSSDWDSDMVSEWSRVRIPVYAHVGHCRCAFAWGVMGALTRYLTSPLIPMGALSLVRDTTASKLSPRTLRCVFLGFPTDAPLWQFYHPRSRRVFSSQDTTFDKSVCYYRLHPHVSHPVPLAPLFLVPIPRLVDPFPPQGPAPSGVSQVDPPPLPAAVDSRAETAGAEPGVAEIEGEGCGGVATGGAGSGGAETGGADSGGAASPSGGGDVGDPTGGPGAGQPQQPDLLETLSLQAICAWIVQRGSPGGGGYGLAVAGAASPGGTVGGTRGAACAGGTGAASPGGTGGATGAGGAGPTSPSGPAGVGGAAAAGTGGAGSAGGTGAAGPRGPAGAGGARGPAGGAGGAAGAGGTRGATGAGGTGATSPAGPRGAGGATGAGGTGAASAGGAGAAGFGGAGGAAGARGAGATTAGGARATSAGGSAGTGGTGPAGALPPSRSSASSY